MAATRRARKPYEIKPLTPGAEIKWRNDGTVRTGVVWSAGPEANSLWVIPDALNEGEHRAAAVKIRKRHGVTTLEQFRRFDPNPKVAVVVGLVEFERMRGVSNVEPEDHVHALWLAWQHLYPSVPFDFATVPERADLKDRDRLNAIGATAITPSQAAAKRSTRKPTTTPKPATTPVVTTIPDDVAAMTDDQIAVERETVRLQLMRETGWTARSRKVREPLEARYAALDAERARRVELQRRADEAHQWQQRHEAEMHRLAAVDVEAMAQRATDAVRARGNAVRTYRDISTDDTRSEVFTYATQTDSGPRDGHKFGLYNHAHDFATGTDTGQRAAEGFVNAWQPTDDVRQVAATRARIAAAIITTTGVDLGDDGRTVRELHAYAVTLCPTITPAAPEATAAPVLAPERPQVAPSAPTAAPAPTTATVDPTPTTTATTVKAATPTPLPLGNAATYRGHRISATWNREQRQFDLRVDGRWVLWFVPAGRYRNGVGTDPEAQAAALDYLRAHVDFTDPLAYPLLVKAA